MCGLVFTRLIIKLKRNKQMVNVGLNIYHVHLQVRIQLTTDQRGAYRLSHLNTSNSDRLLIANVGLSHIRQEGNTVHKCLAPTTQRGAYQNLNRKGILFITDSFYLTQRGAVGIDNYHMHSKATTLQVIL